MNWAAMGRLHNVTIVSLLVITLIHSDLTWARKSPSSGKKSTSTSNRGGSSSSSQKPSKTTKPELANYPRQPQIPNRNPNPYPAGGSYPYPGRGGVNTGGQPNQKPAGGNPVAGSYPGAGSYPNQNPARANPGGYPNQNPGGYPNQNPAGGYPHAAGYPPVGGYPNQNPARGNYPNQYPAAGGYPPAGGYPNQYPGHGGNNPVAGGYPNQNPGRGHYPNQYPAAGGYPVAGGQPHQYPARGGVNPGGYPNQYPAGGYPARGGSFGQGYGQGGYPGGGMGGYPNWNPNNKILSPRYGGGGYGYGHGGYGMGGSPFSRVVQSKGYSPSLKSKGFGKKALMAAGVGAVAGMAIGYGIGRFPRPHFGFHNQQEEYYYNNYMYRRYGSRSTDENDFGRDYVYNPPPQAQSYESFMKSCMNSTDLLKDQGRNWPKSPAADGQDEGDDELVSIEEIGYPALMEQVKSRRCMTRYMNQSESFLQKQTYEHHIQLSHSNPLSYGLMQLLTSALVLLSSVLLLQ